MEFDKDDNLMACHEVVDQIERKCLKEYGTNLVIHLDPVITDDVEINRMQKLVRQWLVQKDSRLAMHDFRIHSCDDKIKVVFDLMIPDEFVSQWFGAKQYDRMRHYVAMSVYLALDLHY